jgi:phosphatidylglycerol lysyltransferase
MSAISLPETERPTPAWLRLLKRAYPFFGLFLFVVALLILKQSASSFRIHDVLRFIEELPEGRIVGAVALLVANLFLFAGYDLLALSYIGKKLPLRKVTFTAILSFAFSNVVGGLVLAGGGIRYRSYSNAGLSGTDVLRLTSFVWISWLLGMAAVDGVAAFAYPHLLDALHGGRLPNLLWYGVPLCLAVVIYLFLAHRGKQEWVLRGLKLPLPSCLIAVGQIGVVVLDLLLSALILYLLLPTLPSIGFAHFMAIFVVAITLSLFSGIPGGLGVFEVLMLHLLKSDLAPADILGALIVFRILYYLLPLAGAAVVLGISESGRWLRPLKPVGSLAACWAIRVIPQIFSLSVLIAGLLMLVTGTLPAAGRTLHWIHRTFPLELFELSHFGASVVGMLLVLFSHGLKRKQHGAFVMALTLLALGTVLEIVNGRILVSGIILGGLFLTLLPCRSAFTRRSTLLAEPFGIKSIVSVLTIAGSTIWLVLFNYRHVEYANELWWKFSFADNASRSLRATASAMVVLLFFGVRKLLQAPAAEPHRPSDEELAEIRSIIGQAPRASAALALLRDKSILFSPSRRSFIMYGVINRIWVAMGDPIGVEDEFPELVWAFRSLCDRHGGRAVVYEVSEGHLAMYADAGFSFFKLGEEAMIPLLDFTLEGPAQRDLRYSYRKMEKLGYRIEILPVASVPDALPRLKEISDAWLRSKGGKEKGFSLGRFDEAYIRNFPVAVVRDPADQVVAFANLWLGNGKSEVSVDLMRYDPQSPNGMMEYLFIGLFLWGHEQGYAAFNLGMAPLAGLEDHPLSPLWTRIGVWIFRNGEHFYHFKGLRNYKEKFNPQWRPRYLASVGNTQLPNELLNITLLISGDSRPSLKRGKKKG